MARSSKIRIDAAGRLRSVTGWEKPTSDEEWCPNCGESADAVITRKQRDAFFLLGKPIYTYDSDDGAFECERCTRTAVGPVELTPEERKRIFE